MKNSLLVENNQLQTKKFFSTKKIKIEFRVRNQWSLVKYVSDEESNECLKNILEEPKSVRKDRIPAILNSDTHPWLQLVLLPVA